MGVTAMKFKRVVEGTENVEIEASPEQKQQLLDFLVFFQKTDMIDAESDAFVMDEDVEEIIGKVQAQTNSENSLILTKQNVNNISGLITATNAHHIPIELENFPKAVFNEIDKDIHKIRDIAFGFVH